MFNAIPNNLKDPDKCKNIVVKREGLSSSIILLSQQYFLLYLSSLMRQ